MATLESARPRPEQVHLAKTYAREIPHFECRLLVPPGLTGLAQVSSGYAEDVEKTRTKLRYDLAYISRLGLATDCRILLNTLRLYWPTGNSTPGRGPVPDSAPMPEGIARAIARNGTS